QVGLGTARNFSTARPIFQQLTQNVPVAGRAIYEADWDLEKRKMKGKMRRDLKPSNEKENVHSTLRAKPIEKTRKVVELERYFPEPAPAASDMTTVLLVPLAPTPTSRLPLTETQATEPNLLVVSDLQEVLSTHRIHSLRVSSLFARLDA
ncbi:uncharacterized protein FOMMEDRAFT_67178, partial [Fomitiporia mediterranea MF3/22]|uniref:uncharacterized protein n=1 Tax=Fomitiporia mediterranea (strain MF3/22) TaxID=694068 RepID=UPI0004409967